MAAFWVINRQFQKFIDSQFTLDYDSQMADKYFDEYTGIEVKLFRETLLQHMTNVKKFVAERTHHQRKYDRRGVLDCVLLLHCDLPPATCLIVAFWCCVLLIEDPFASKYKRYAAQVATNIAFCLETLRFVSCGLSRALLFGSAVCLQTLRFVHCVLSQDFIAFCLGTLAFSEDCVLSRKSCVLC
ncbi:hypothetical protein Tco_1056792 [Tanacetum coccineum]|uniref:Uncharacterized protein n=1 Tax=Tanacetum coccineum TaxID=301880 RepID=A0ABQ5H451_9ASTR